MGERYIVVAHDSSILTEFKDMIHCKKIKGTHNVRISTRSAKEAIASVLHRSMRDLSLITNSVTTIEWTSSDQFESELMKENISSM